MKVEILECIAGANYVHNRGDIVEMPDDEARRYIASNAVKPMRDAGKKVETATTKNPKVEKATKGLRIKK